jgi:hypothetical protein
VTDNARGEFRFCITFFRPGEVEDGQRLCNTEKDGRISQESAGTDASAKSESEGMRIDLGVVTQEAFGFKRCSIMVYVGVMGECPVLIREVLVWVALDVPDICKNQ